METSELLDQQTLNELRGVFNEEAEMRDAFQVFFDSVESRLDACEQALEAGNTQQLKLAWHSIRGSAANFGAGALALVSRELEAAIEGTGTTKGELTRMTAAARRIYQETRAVLERPLGCLHS